MKQPLILLLYEKMFPGTHLVNRLQDLGYEVQVLSDAAAVLQQAEQGKPLLLIADLEPRDVQVCEAISRLKKNSSTAHIPIIALVSAKNTALQQSARNAGATLVVLDNTILVHLKDFVNQALQVD